MLETLESIVAEAESTWWRAEAARGVTSQVQAGARIKDIADRYVPVYTVDLLKLAQCDVDLATTEPTLEGVLERRLTATALIARNVFDAVTDHLWRLYYAAVANEAPPGSYLSTGWPHRCLFLAAVARELCDPARRDDVSHARVNAGHRPLTSEHARRVLTCTNP